MRKINSYFFLIIGICLSHGCMSQSVETNAKNAPNQQPAFASQTRVKAIKTKEKVGIKIITEGLESPWGLDFLPDGRFIVSEKEGKIRIVSQDGKIGNPLKNVPSVRVYGVSGMMDVKVSPDFKNNRFVFWTYPEPVENSRSVNCIARGVLSADETSLDNVKVIFRASHSNSDGFHLGSRMLFDKDGLMYVTIGDRYSRDVRDNAQNKKSHLGKVLRITQEGLAASGNPFENDNDALPEIWSLGHRNPQGLAFNNITSELWESEHGPNGGDELNIIKPKINYGWPILSYGIADTGGPLTGETQKEGLQQPVYYWDPVISPCGMTFYSGNKIAEWKNNLFVGALRGTHIARLIIDNKKNSIIAEEKLLADEWQRFRHIVQGTDEYLYAITDQGRLYKIGNNN
jgi:aldose sugar dehydrogenase